MNAARGLTHDEQQAFREHGYVIVRGALTPADLAPVIAEFQDVIDRTARALHAAGSIDATHAGADFETRLGLLTERTDGVFRALFSGASRGPALFELLRHEKILALTASLLGDELMCHPAYRVRPKLPDLPLTRRLTVVPWHQDSAYLTPDCDAAELVTVWTALTVSTVENGCVEVIPDAHRGGILPHRNVRGRAYLDIVPEALPATPPVAVVAQPGDVLLMTHLTPHRSLPNTTARIRWSVDARYHRAEQSSGYPPEAGFLARSRLRPDAVVSTVEEFARVRASHQAGAAPRRQRWPEEAPEA